MQITYKDKVALQNDESIPEESKVTDKNMNEIKRVVNENDTQTTNALANKVDKIAGKGLSTNDFTNEEQNKLAGLENYDDTELKEECDKLKRKITLLQSNQITDKASGEDLYLDGSGEANFIEFNERGHSEQETTTGKNKFDGEIELGTLNNSDGSKTDVNNAIRSKNYIEVNASTNYVLSNSNNYTTFIYFYNTNNEFISYTNSASFTTTDETKYVKFRTVSNQNNLTTKFQLEEGTTATDYEPYTGGQVAPSPIYPFPVKSCGDNVNLADKSKFANNYSINTDGLPISSTGRIATLERINVSFANQIKVSFSITGGNDTRYIYSLFKNDGTLVKREAGYDSSRVIDASNADYMYLCLYDSTNLTLDMVNFIKVEKGDKATPYSPYGMGCMNEKIQNKNLFNKNNVIDGYRFGSNGDLFADSDFCASYPINIQPNTTLVFNKFQGSECICEYDKNDKFLKRTIGNNTSRITTTTTTEYVRMAVNITHKDIYQLEQGSTTTDYVVYQEQNISIPTQQPFRSIGDVRDEFIKKDDGKWYERHYSNIYTFTENDNWVETDNHLAGCFTIYKPSPLKQPTSTYKALCTNLQGVQKPNYGTNDNPNSIGVSADRFNIYIPNITTVEECKAIMAGQTVQFLSQDPQDILCTQEQSDILDSLDDAYSYKGGTYISSEDEVKPKLNVTFTVDTKAYIDNKFNEVSRALVAQGGV